MQAGPSIHVLIPQYNQVRLPQVHRLQHIRKLRQLNLSRHFCAPIMSCFLSPTITAREISLRQAAQAYYLITFCFICSSPVKRTARYYRKIAVKRIHSDYLFCKDCRLCVVAYSQYLPCISAIQAFPLCRHISCFQKFPTGCTCPCIFNRCQGTGLN